MQEDLSFYYSAMKGGKTTRIFQKIHDLEENGQTVLLIKPMIDTKGNDYIINRKGETRKVDGEFTFNGEEIEIDGANKKIEYVPLCGACYYKKVYTKKKKVKEEIDE